MMKRRVHMAKVLIFLFCFACLSALHEMSYSVDTLTAEDSIIDGQELTSAGASFVLGFFSPENSTSHYIGIWYKNITPPTVVWIANRERPLNDSHGKLTIGADGNIVLLDGAENVVWRTISSRATQQPTAKLLDSGNFVLMDGQNGDSDSYMWQSFDYPTDTLLPGMKLGWDKNSGLNRYLTSWKSDNDPSAGNFTYRFDHTEFPEIVIRQGSNIMFRSGIWNGVQMNADNWTSFAAFRPVISVTNNELIYWVQPGDSFFRFVMESDGKGQGHVWDIKTMKWNNMYEVRKDFCDNYGACGANGICTVKNVPVYCDCLKGFKPKSQEEWNASNMSSGCIRETPLNCTQGDKFAKLSWVRLPMLLQFWTNNSINLEDCQAECLKNCSCTAYAYSAMNGGPHGCLLWFGDLIDIRMLISEEGTQQDLYVRLAASDVGLWEEPNFKGGTNASNNAGTNASTNAGTRRTVAVIISVSLAMLLFGSILYLAKKYKERKISNNFVAGQTNRNEQQTLPFFDTAAIIAATDNFSRENKIGQGGFGSVYKGKLVDGQEIAVKKLSKTSKQGIPEFMNEVGLVANLQHRNLVRVLGGCTQGEERMLVYEYMPNRSLDRFIFDPSQGKFLGWRKRYDIVVGIARGLLYLHQDSRLNIIHRDLKTNNILLDRDMNPKISDFGLAHIFEGDDYAVTTKRIVGTLGYMSPEYVGNGIFSVKSDVFSFGVVVLEILSGTKNTNCNYANHRLNLLGQAWILWKQGRPLEFVDVNLDLTTIPSELLRCLQVGLLCVQKLPEDRPTMLSVVFMLGNESMTLPHPKEPGFFNEDFYDHSEKYSGSNNSMTITLLEARC